MGRLLSVVASFLRKLLGPSANGSDSLTIREAHLVDSPTAQEIERVTFALIERSKYSTTPKLLPKKKALMPRPTGEGGRLELSTYCIDGLNEEGIWQLIASTFPDKRVPARSDFQASQILALELSLDPNWVPPRHVDICGWPQQEDAQALLGNV